MAWHFPILIDICQSASSYVLLPLKWKEWDMTVVLNHSSGHCSLLGWKSDLSESLTSLRRSCQMVKCPKYKKEPGCFAYPFLQRTVSVLTCKSSPNAETLVSVRTCYVYGEEPDPHLHNTSSWGPNVFSRPISAYLIVWMYSGRSEVADRRPVRKNLAKPRTKTWRNCIRCSIRFWEERLRETYLCD